ncbi:MAG TPA: hypothetical protein VGK84_03970, partial [Candidatus Tumulicola sp.]
MTVVRGPLDASLSKQILRPSDDFADFVGQYFFDSQRYGGLKPDSTLLNRLIGLERETAIAMIASNLPSAQVNLLEAAVQLDMRNAIPILKSMQSEEYDDYEQYVIAKAI